MNLYHLRRYRREDRTACLLLFEGNIPGSFFPFEIPGFLEFLDCLPGPYLVVEEVGGRLIGCGGLAEHEDVATLCWGMVAQDRQKQGIGRFLLRARLTLATSNPRIRVVNLNTTQLTAPFFAREGFLTRKVTLNSYRPGLHRHDMELKLDAAGREKISGYVGHDSNRDRD
jgi:GNAT superfamily N-acetyltransferase